MDGCIEVIIRCSNTASIISRQITTNAVVLGHVIPKDTGILFLGHGGGIFSLPYKIDDNLRSKSYHNAYIGRIGNWDTNNITKFDPEPWLVHNQDTGTRIFNPSAGPHIAFGRGPRGCLDAN